MYQRPLQYPSQHSQRGMPFDTPVPATPPDPQMSGCEGALLAVAANPHFVLASLTRREPEKTMNKTRQRALT